MKTPHEKNLESFDKLMEKPACTLTIVEKDTLNALVSEINRHEELELNRREL